MIVASMIEIVIMRRLIGAAAGKPRAQRFEQAREGVQHDRVDTGEQVAAERLGLNPHLGIQVAPGVGQMDLLDPAVARAGGAQHQARLLQAVQHRHHRRALDAQLVGQRALRQGFVRACDDRNRHPARLPYAEVLQACIERDAPSARGGVQRDGEALQGRIR
jgi:hypothetical protein